ncbi:hypothetical protein [Psychromonas antarctica]|uniref:hypothetical protein n=1 Tax=Psychromonas antarctica TaxID=67573 RepID=UPI001EE96EEC|nr:hypothetical protein [Psychromonas antarctica]MCG6202827.1 hypothetical protein [Psychromonas antarctica]
MKIIKIALTAVLLLFSLSTYATPMTFSSSINDGCTGGCTALGNNYNTYVVPDSTTDLYGASWIQSLDTWFVAGVSYSIWETDFSNIGDSTLTSLYVSYDDDLIIYNGSEAIFNSLDTGIMFAWTGVVNVFDYLLKFRGSFLANKSEPSLILGLLAAK